MKLKKTINSILIASSALLATSYVTAEPFGGRNGGINFDGAVYVMSNKLDGNSIFAVSYTHLTLPTTPYV